MKTLVGSMALALWGALVCACTLQHPAFGPLEFDGGEDASDVTTGPRDGNVCGLPGQLCCPTAPVCSSGAVCASDNLCIVGCPAGEATCGGRCVNRQSDINHCGACGNSCVRAHAASACVMGTCMVGGCDPGFSDCDGNPANGCEADLSSAPANCGACGTSCAFANASATCQRGVCVRGPCNPGFDDCNADPIDGCETSLNTSVANCGRCGMACSIPMAVSECAMGACRVNRCPAGTGDCNGTMADGCETDVQTSTSHCGGCGMACTFAHASAVCNAGVCAMGACEAGYGDCDSNPANGCETNLSTSPNHCGACRRACAPTMAMGACVAGVCGVGTCTPNFANCDGNPANGCEVDLRVSPNHCGGCGRVCALPNAVTACAMGVCRVMACNAGFADCDGNPGNGCETRVQSDAANCGMCGRVCAIANGTGGCASGACVIASCRTGFADCDRRADNGCETDTRTSTSNCGSCGARCTIANATNACVSGVCTLARCNAPFENCDGNPANGCETDTRSSASNCGGCGMVCPGRAHAQATCSNAACGITCDANFGNCDGMASNGCEADLTSPSTCGSCTLRCSVLNGTAGCSSGMCTVANCTAPFENCDNRYSNGCEVNVRTDVNNCRGCGMVCRATGATPTCMDSVCSFTCNAGLGDCDGNPSNGCETNITASATNCGACGNTCMGGAHGMGVCMASSCRLSCSTGFGDCDGMIANGCETDLSSDVANCGRCRNACMGTGAMCSGGMCR